MIETGKGFALRDGVDRTGITLTARELYQQGYHAGVIAVCTDVLVRHPDHLPVRSLLTRALLALRKDKDAERQIAEILRIDSNSSIAFQFLGEIAFRGDDLATAEIYFREACRLDRGNASARIWLDVVLVSSGYGALEDSLAAFGTPSQKSEMQPESALPMPSGRLRFAGRPEPAPGTAPSGGRLGGYLVENGILSRKELQHALSYHRQKRVRVGEAAVTLGYVSQQKLGWALTGFHSRR